jgi:hypothetical protein
LLFRSRRRRIKTMNITEGETPFNIVAKTCGCKDNDNDNDKKKKVTYTFIDAYHGLSIDKKDIISAELQACERLLKDNSADEIDRRATEKEIAELKFALYLLP